MEDVNLIDFSKCILCREGKKEKLLNLQSENSNPIDNYKTLESWLIKFSEIKNLEEHLQTFLKIEDVANYLFKKHSGTKDVESNLEKLQKKIELSKNRQNKVQSDESVINEESLEFCIICNETDMKDNLHSVMKSSTFDTLLEAARKTEASELIERLSMRIGSEKYHGVCFSDLYKKSKKPNFQATGEETETEAAYSALWKHIESCLKSDCCVLTLNDLKTKFMENMK